MEQVDLTSPEIQPQIVTSAYQVIFLALDWHLKLIIIRLRGTNREVKEYRYESDEALVLMTSLNKANLSVQSLHRRILARLIADNKIAGTVSGSLD